MTDDTLMDALRYYEKKGFDGQFLVRPGGMVHCMACDTDEPAAQVSAEAMHRFEGNSDPNDEALLVALECPACGAWGTVTLSYGPSSSPDDGAVMVELLDARDVGPIKQGL